MSYYFRVLKDNPIGFWKLDELSGTSAIDYSGAGNNGTFSQSVSDNNPPLVIGGVVSNKINSSKYISFPITKNYYGVVGNGGVANINSLDSSFSMECWFASDISDPAEVPIFADGDTGIFYENGNLKFKFGQYECIYKLLNLKKSYHVVGVYSVSAIYLYVDGKIASYSYVTDTPEITNSTTTFQAGPTNELEDSFLFDSPAVYRYDLKQSSILEHYNSNIHVPAIQVGGPEGASIFEIYDNNISTKYYYSYPGNKPWTYFINEDLHYNNQEQYLEILKTDSADSKTVVIEDVISLPLAPNMNSSKIEWGGDNGISVEVSTDGTTYSSCINDAPIPGYTIDNFDSERIVHLKITLSTDDASVSSPRLSFLAMTFYNDNSIYSINSSDYISSDTDVSLGSKVYPLFSRDFRNGIRAYENSGFSINTEKDISHIEFFYTPSSSDQSLLISCGTPSTQISWNSSGVLSKTNISSIYINGINKSSETNISNILNFNDLNFIGINLTQPVSGSINFNYSPSGSKSSLYQNISLYENTLTQEDSANHYGIYASNISTETNDSSLTLTENGVKYYDNDWVVVQSV